MDRPAIVYEVPEAAVRRACRACREIIAFVPTESGRLMPCNEDGTSHFATCNDPKRFRKPKK